MDFLYSLLHFSPFRDFMAYLESQTSGFGNFLKYLNWFIPIAQMIGVLELWGVAILAWYGAQIVLRNLRAIQ
ncbi:MAG: hypothetical protein LBR72_07760 [Oscillospiraceae bacterium]|jgi:hypothetical protein|nr:hypothetical protein [Oscillospiraceae bacterium]